MNNILTKKFVKFKFNSKNEVDSFTCIFQGFQYLIDFALFVNNQMNKANKNQSTMKKYMKNRGHLAVN